MEKENSITLNRTWHKRLVLLIIFAAMFVRVVLGFLNHEANDDHLSVVAPMVAEHRIPEKTECWSCYQPKLYYLVCAGLIGGFDIQAERPRVKVMQLVNVFTSFFMLLIFWKFINKQSLPPWAKLLTFAFFAFNPCLVGINVHGANDTPAIFFGVLALYACDSYFRSKRLSMLAVLVISLIAGALTKASAFVLIAAISLAFIVKILAEPVVATKVKTGLHFIALLAFFLLIVPAAGGYYHNYKAYGSLTLSAWGKDPPPAFFEKAYITNTNLPRAGLRSIAEGFFTFRYFDMLRQPYINNAGVDYPLHRTSLWSQLYGRTVFMHFDQWPPTWQTQAPFIVFIGRALIALGLVPLGLFAAGIFYNAVTGIKNLLALNRAYLAEPQHYLFAIITLALLASSVYYTYNYRDFSSMKSIYIFPGILAFIKMFTDGFQLLKSKWVITFSASVLCVMVLLSIADISFLISQLYDQAQTGRDIWHMNPMLW